jgi:hypothetical protein
MSEMKEMKSVVRSNLAAGATLATLAAAAAGCGSAPPPVPVPTPVAPPSVTNTATGTLHISGSNYYQFQVATSGEVDVTLTSLMTVPVQADPTANPPVTAVPAVPVGVPVTLTVGQPSLTTLGVSCSVLKTTSTSPGTSPQLTGHALAGNFCISISDPNGALPAAVNYVVLIAHS